MNGNKDGRKNEGSKERKKEKGIWVTKLQRKDSKQERKGVTKVTKEW